MKKKYILCVIPISILLIATVWCLIINFRPKQKESPIQKIGESPCAKFECRNSKEDGILISSEIFLLSNTFSSLDLVESEIPVTDWLYRITFNCAELFQNNRDNEIVVLIGDNAMSIDGKSYCTPEDVPFESVVELFDSKYKYFANSYTDDED